jgi:hypothetical protein
MEHSIFISPELIKALHEGFTLPFTFVGGVFHCDLIPSKVYAPSDVSKDVRPCVVSETTVYRLHMPDGLKGHAIVRWEDQQDN